MYAAAMAGLLLFLRAIDYHYLITGIKTEYYISVLAVFFTALGLWIGRKLTARPEGVDIALSIKAGPISAGELGISDREAEVLRLIAAGHSNQEIADRLFLSLHTVKKHSSTLLRKLSVERRTQAIKKARRLGIIE